MTDRDILSCDEVRKHFDEAGQRWYFVEGGKPKGKTVVKGAQVGRNDPCTCGSGKKYKKCCGAAA